MMNNGLEIKLYYSEKLNNIVKRLPEIGADKEVLKQCFALLARLDNNLMTFKLDNKLITVEEPERLVEIKKHGKSLKAICKLHSLSIYGGNDHIGHCRRDSQVVLQNNKNIIMCYNKFIIKL